VIFFFSFSSVLGIAKKYRDEGDAGSHLGGARKGLLPSLETLLLPFEIPITLYFSFNFKHSNTQTFKGMLLTSPSLETGGVDVMIFFFSQELCPLHSHPGGGHCVGDAAGTHHGGGASWHREDRRGCSDHQQSLPQLPQPAHTAGHSLQSGPQPGTCVCVRVHTCVCACACMCGPDFADF